MLTIACFYEFPINKISDPREKEDDERDVAEQELRLRELLKANEELQRKVAEVNYQIKVHTVWTIEKSRKKGVCTELGNFGALQNSCASS